MDMKKLKVAFQNQRRSAGKRGIGFHLTFEQWLDLWEKSGHLKERGRGAGKYVMSRKDDDGDYEIGNVFIQTHAQNVSDSWKDKTKAKDRKKKQSDAQKDRTKIECPYCHISCDTGSFSRWHGDKCKYK